MEAGDRMDYYKNNNVYYGDIHNHCDISYGKGSLEDAFYNAKQNLDFCSVTGHADWPDLPDGGERAQSIRDYHHAGFAKLKKGWKETLKTVVSYNIEGEFLTFPGFEIHSRGFGDYPIVYKDLDGELILEKNIPNIKKVMEDLEKMGKKAMAFPHHISYIKGGRGLLKIFLLLLRFFLPMAVRKLIRVPGHPWVFWDLQTGKVQCSTVCQKVIFLE